MNATINIVSTGLLVLIVLGAAAAWVSPDLLERWAVKLMARSRALRFSRQAYDVEYAGTLQRFGQFERFCSEQDEVEAQFAFREKD